MKFLAFVDMHQDMQDFEILQKRIESNSNISCIVCLGDFTFFGHNMQQLLEILNSLGKKLYLIHGNHEDEKSIEKIINKYKNIAFVHKQIVEIEGVNFVFFGGGGFSSREPEFKELIKKNQEKLGTAKKIVLATHPPPYKTTLDELSPGWHVGVKDFKEFIEKYNPILAISGHIHENYKKTQKYKKTILANPGGDGEVFEV